MFQNRIGSLAVHLMSRSMMYTILYTSMCAMRERMKEENWWLDYNCRGRGALSQLINILDKCSVARMLNVCEPCLVYRKCRRATLLPAGRPNGMKGKICWKNNTTHADSRDGFQCRIERLCQTIHFCLINGCGLSVVLGELWLPTKYIEEKRKKNEKK